MTGNRNPGDTHDIGARRAESRRRTAVADKVDFRELTAALYRVVSAAPAQRDWQAVRPLYHPDARLVRTGVGPDGTPFVRVFTLDAYIANVRELLDGETRFSEVEIAQESVVFGNVARLTSVYEFTWQSPQETRRGRGVNFFTLVREAGQWRVMSIVWDNERPGLSLPPEVYAPRAAS
jgi:hypothetical protein